MKKNNKKKKKKKNINFNNKNNKIEGNKKSTEIENNGDKEVWKKILLFMIIFPPYALYLFLFKTKVSKYMKAIVIVFVSILLFIIVDTVRYPNRIHDEVVFSHIQEIKSEGKIDIGTIYNIEKKTTFKYKDGEYLAYNLYDEYDMYYGIFEVEEYNKEYNLVYLYRLSNKFEVVYSDNTFVKFDKIHPVVFVHMLTDENFPVFEKISNASDIETKDIFENNKYQVITIEDDDINFEFNDFGVVEYESASGDVEYCADINPLMNTEFKSVYNVLSRNFQDDYKIVGFSYFDIMPVFNILVGNNKYIVQYYHGEGASLQSIEDENKYFDFLKERYEINVLNK